ncbi:MAG: YceI family protein [Granulosicoccus sp.]
MIRISTIHKSALFSSILVGCVLTAANAADLSAVPSGGYEVDTTHAYINFQYNHLGLSNPTLSFDDFTVDLDLDNSDPTQSSLAVTIDPASIITGSDIWKDHLTGGDWFNVAAHPQITFQSTSIEGAGDGAYVVTGDLTIKEMSKPVTLNVAINAAMNHPMSGKPVIGLDASGSVLRSDFGMGKFAPNVSDEVLLNISVELLKAAE